MPRRATLAASGPSDFESGLGLPAREPLLIDGARRVVGDALTHALGDDCAALGARHRGADELGEAGGHGRRGLGASLGF